jgi:hypothetical protein
VIRLLRGLRALVLGETWTIPLGVGATVAAVAIAAGVLGRAFHPLLGFAVLAGAVVTLAGATRG